MIESFYCSSQFRCLDQNYPRANGLPENFYTSYYDNSKPPWDHMGENKEEKTIVRGSNVKNKIVEGNKSKKMRNHQRLVESLTFYEYLVEYLLWWKNTFIALPTTKTLQSEDLKFKTIVGKSMKYTQKERILKSVVQKRSHRICLLPSSVKKKSKSKIAKVRVSKKTPKNKHSMKSNNELCLVQNKHDRNGNILMNSLLTKNYSVAISRNGFFTIFNSTNIDEILKTNTFLEGIISNTKETFHVVQKNPNFDQVFRSGQHINLKTKVTQYKTDLKQKEPNETIGKKCTLEFFKRFFKAPFSSVRFNGSESFMFKDRTRVRGLSHLLKTFSNKFHLFDNYKIIADEKEIEKTCISLIDKNCTKCADQRTLKQSTNQQCTLTARNIKQTPSHKPPNNNIVNQVNDQYNVKNRSEKKPILKEKACELLLRAEKNAEERRQDKKFKVSLIHDTSSLQQQKFKKTNKRTFFEPPFKHKISQCQQNAINTRKKQNGAKTTSRFFQLKIPSIQNGNINGSTQYDEKKINNKIKLFDKKKKDLNKKEPIVRKITNCLIPAVQCEREGGIICLDLGCIRKQCMKNQNNNDENQSPLHFNMKQLDDSRKKKMKNYLKNFPSMTNKQIRAVLSNTISRQTRSILCIPLSSDAYYLVKSNDNDSKSPDTNKSLLGKNRVNDRIKTSHKEIKKFHKKTNTTQDNKRAVQLLNPTKGLSCIQETNDSKVSCGKTQILCEHKEKNWQIKTGHHDCVHSTFSKEKLKYNKPPNNLKIQEEMEIYGEVNEKACQQKQSQISNINHKTTRATKSLWAKVWLKLGTKAQEQEQAGKGKINGQLKQKHHRKYQTKKSNQQQIKYRNEQKRFYGAKSNQHEADCHNGRVQQNKKMKQQSCNVKSHQSMYEPNFDQNNSTYNNKQLQKLDINLKKQSYNKNQHQQNNMYPPSDGKHQKGLENRQPKQCDIDSKQLSWYRNHQKKVNSPNIKQYQGGFQNRQTQQISKSEKKSYFDRKQQQKVYEQPHNMKNQQHKEYRPKLDQCSACLHNRQSQQCEMNTKQKKVDTKSQRQIYGRNCVQCKRDFYATTFQNNEKRLRLLQYQQKQLQLIEQQNYLKRLKQLHHQHRIEYLKEFLKECEKSLQDEYKEPTERKLESSQTLNQQRLQSFGKQQNHHSKLKLLEIQQGMQCLERFINDYEKNLQGNSQEQKKIHYELSRMAAHQTQQWYSEQNCTFRKIQKLRNQKSSPCLKHFLQDFEQERLSGLQQENNINLDVMQTSNHYRHTWFNEQENLHAGNSKLIQTKQQIQGVTEPLLEYKRKLRNESQQHKDRHLESLQMENQPRYRKPSQNKQEEQKQFGLKCKFCPINQKEQQYEVQENQCQKLFHRKQQSPPKSNNHQHFQDLIKQKINFIVCRRCLYSDMIYNLPNKLRLLSSLTDESIKYSNVCLICEDKDQYHIPSVANEQEIHTFDYTRAPVFQPRTASNVQHACWIAEHSQSSGDGNGICFESRWLNTLESDCNDETRYNFRNSRDVGDFVILNHNLRYSRRNKSKVIN